MRKLLSLSPLIILILINLVSIIQHSGPELYHTTHTTNSINSISAENVLEYEISTIHYITSLLLVIALVMCFVKETIGILLTGIIILLCNFWVLQLYFGVIEKTTFMGIPMDMYMILLFILYLIINGKKIGAAYYSINNSLAKLDK